MWLEYVQGWVGLGSKPSFDDSATMEYNCGSFVRRSLIQELFVGACC